MKNFTKWGVAATKVETQHLITPIFYHADMKKILIIWYIVVISFLSVDNAFAEAEVYWPSFDLPPLFIYDEHGNRSGLGDDLNKYMQQRLSGCAHLNTITSPKKILLEAKQGKKMVITGVLKNTKREHYLYYSRYPCRMSWSMVAIIRKEDKNRLTTDGKFPLTTNIKNNQLKFSYINGVYYDKLTDLISKVKCENRSTAKSISSIDTSHQVNLLVNKRIDFFFADPLIIFEMQNQKNKHNIELVECVELPVMPMYGYFATPKTLWGYNMMKKINKILKQVICSGQLKRMINSWIPDNLKGKFKEGYSKGIAEKVICGH